MDTSMHINEAIKVPCLPSYSILDHYNTFFLGFSRITVFSCTLVLPFYHLKFESTECILGPKWLDRALPWLPAIRGAATGLGL